MKSADPIAVLDDLDPEQLQQRLEELDAERRAICVLLRASRARQRARRKAADATAGRPQGGQPCLA